MFCIVFNSRLHSHHSTHKGLTNRKPYLFCMRKARFSFSFLFYFFRSENVRLVFFKTNCIVTRGKRKGEGKHLQQDHRQTSETHRQLWAAKLFSTSKGGQPRPLTDLYFAQVAGTVLSATASPRFLQ